MTKRAKRRLASEINVVPYIDVMLVLLIIFMITAPLLTTGVKVDLPDAQAKTMDFSKENQPIVLTVKKNGDLYLNVGRNPNRPLAPAQVTRIASTVLSERPEAPVAVRGAGAGDYANVVRGMVLLQNAGAEQVGLLTDDVAGPTLSGGEEEAPGN